MAKAGFWRSATPQRPELLRALILVAVCLPAAAQARDRVIAVTIPATTLDAALLTLARTSGVEIASTESGLRAVRSRPLRGTMTVAAALDTLLAGSGYRAIAFAHGGYRIVAAPRKRLPPPHPRAAPPPRAEAAPADIIVTASKQRVPLLRYPGSLTLIGKATQANGSAAAISDLAAADPILQSTQLGAGRNKVFIRGIADSSFNGTTQSTASVYLDDVQLNASGPDPGLRLYDMQAIEVMEGPQGTLYGAGAIGGVLRLTSNAPVLDRVAAAAGGGVTATQGGAAGFDLSGMLNLPLLDERLALRGVAYGVRDGGYIDDPVRGRAVNRVDTIGGRVALRVQPGPGWRIDVSGAGQRIEAADGQYAETRDSYRRSSRLAQPYRNRFLFGRVVVSKDWDSGLRLVSATGVADYHTRELFDATPRGSSRPAIYTVDNDKLLLSQELRLSRSIPGGPSWLAGVTLVSDNSVLSRALGGPGNPMDIVGVTNVTRAASAFGETTLAVAPALSMTVGGRFTSARVDGEPSATRRPNAYIKGRSTQRIDPTLALSYRLAPDVALFARYQTGFRTGGLAVAQGIGRVANFAPDSIAVGEVGLRRLRSGTTGLGLSVSAATARWRGIQADLLNRRGQPFTTNLGDANIQTLEAAIDWVPVVGLSVAASALYTYNRVRGPVADQSREDNRRLPETPPFAGHAAVDYGWASGRPVEPRVGVTFDYIGRSVLGTGDLLDVSQGRYATLGASAGLRWRRVDVTLGLDNVTNAAANRFAFGNPFGLAARNQVTPLRPRNARLGVSVAW